MPDLHVIHQAIVKDGHIAFKNPEMVKQDISKLEGKEIDVIIRKQTYPRTNQENRYYWGVIIRMIADEMGVIPDEAHLLLKGLFLKRGIEYKGRRWEIVSDTHTLSIQDFEGYCDKCRLWASTELFLNIPLPNEISF